jgi:hypothetical protein
VTGGRKFILSAVIATALPAFAAAADRPVEQAGTQDACMKVARPVPYGSIASRRDLVAAPCGDGRAARPFLYDASVRGMRATRPLAVGEIIGAIPPFALPEVREGDSVTLSTTVGPITVERQVVALQAAHEGAEFFVRGGDGNVFVASPRDIRR